MENGTDPNNSDGDEIANGTVLTKTFVPQDNNGYVTTLAPVNFGAYWDIYFIWRAMFQTPSGQIEYIIYFTGFKQQMDINPTY